MRKIFGLEGGSEQQPRLLSPWLTDFLIPFGSLLIAGLALFAQPEQLPKGVLIIAIFYLVVVAGVSLYFPVVRLGRLVLHKARVGRLARKTLPRLEESVRQLGPLIALEQTNTLLYVLREAGGWDEIKGHASVCDTEHVETLRTWLAAIEREVSSLGVEIG